jgi:hypothetical protein
MKKTKEQKHEEAILRKVEKRSVRAQLKSLDAAGHAAVKERARLNALLEKHITEKAETALLEKEA